MRFFSPLSIAFTALVASVPSIGFAQSTLYGLVQTSGFNELTAYNLNQTGGFSYDATSVIPLNITNLLPQNSITDISIQGTTLYGLVKTSGFNELITYDLNQTGGFGYDAGSVIPLNITNLLPQNSITGISVQGSTLYGLVRTSSFNELITYDLNQTGGFGYDASSVIPLNITNLLPQNSITSFSIQGSTFYGLIQTSGFNELITYDLNQTGGFGYDASSIIPLNITNLLPQNSITSISVVGSTLYGLIQTSGFNELITYDLNQTGGFGYDATSIIPLNITNLLPQNSIVAIDVVTDGVTTPVPEPASAALLTLGLALMGCHRLGRWRVKGRRQNLLG